jgi:hypothetical protein
MDYGLIAYKNAKRFLLKYLKSYISVSYADFCPAEIAYNTLLRARWLLNSRASQERKLQLLPLAQVQAKGFPNVGRSTRTYCAGAEVVNQRFRRPNAEPKRQ